jgi:hypothetical protein
MRIRLQTGAWVGSLGLIFGGTFAVLSATLEQHELANSGWLSIIFGIALAVWAVTIDGKHWWERIPLAIPFKWRRGIYVGRMVVSDSLLDTDHYLDLTIMAYNGTARTLRYRRATGQARAEFTSKGNGLGGFDLQPATFMAGDNPWRSGGELMLNFRLPLTPAQVIHFRSHQASGAMPQILFQNLVITFSRRFGGVLKLPIWDGISFLDPSLCGKIHFSKTTFFTSAVSIAARAS